MPDQIRREPMRDGSGVNKKAVCVELVLLFGDRQEDGLGGEQDDSGGV